MIMGINKQQKRRKRMAIIIVIVIVIALALTFVIPLAQMAYAAETPPPPDYNPATMTHDPAPWVDDPEEPVEEVLPPMLRIMNTNIQLDVGQQLQIQLDMENFPEGTILEWASRNPAVAGVDPYGVVVAYSPGRAEVFVSAMGIMSSVLVTVHELKANKISIIVGDNISQLGPRLYEVTVGDVIKLGSRIEPEGAKVDKIVWKLGNENVASINPNSQTCEFIAEAVGETQVTVTADGIVDAVSFRIVESGVPIDMLWTYIKYGIILVIVIIVAAVVLTSLAQRHKKIKAREAREKAQKAAAAKRRKEEAERLAREEAAERRAREEAMERRAREEAAQRERQREMLEPRPARAEERITQRVNGSAVGASVSAPRDEEKEPDRPLTLDDLE